MPRLVEVHGHQWAYVGGPMRAFKLISSLSKILGPTGSTVLGRLLVTGFQGAWAGLVEHGRKLTERRKVDAAAGVEGAGVEAVLRAYAQVRAVVPDDLLTEIQEALQSPAMNAWLREVTSLCTRDGVPVDPDDPELSTGEVGAALWGVCVAEGFFPSSRGTGAEPGPG
jgi:hypothetical protein